MTQFDDIIKHQIAMHHFKEHCDTLAEGCFSKDFCLACSSGYLSAMHALGYLTEEDVIRLFENLECKLKNVGI